MCQFGGGKGGDRERDFLADITGEGGEFGEPVQVVECWGHRSLTRVGTIPPTRRDFPAAAYYLRGTLEESEAGEAEVRGAAVAVS